MILSRSLDNNYLTNYGRDMSAVLKLAEVLPQSKLQTLRCLSAKCGRSLLAPADACELVSVFAWFGCVCWFGATGHSSSTMLPCLLGGGYGPTRPLLMNVAFESDEY